MSKNLLFEIGTEEIPAKYMHDTLGQIKVIAENKLNENRIRFKNIKALGTPRRIILIVGGLEEKQSDIDEFIKGPSKKVAFDESGQPTKAALGFLKSQGAQEKDAIIQLVGDIEYIFVKKHEKGKETSEILKSILPEIIYSLSFPKSMRWSNYNIKFARPIRWIVALLGEEVIEFSMEGVSSSKITRGHRTLSNKEIEINNADEYIDKMRNEFVMVSQHERKKVIVDQINKIVQDKNAKALIDEELLEEVIYLVEYPTALMGEFEDEFLELPKEAVITPMKEHQRYFPVFDENNKLLPCFITVRNGNDEYLDIVRIGNERVLRARLKDAQFFYNEDLKHKLEDRVESLKAIVYQEKLGTIYDKVERIAKIGEFIGQKIGLNKEQRNSLNRAAYLCKTDLMTGMVNEFDELQGIMGREYALKNGENEEIAQSIFSHYLPKFSGDETPNDVIGQILSISDRMDSIIGSFGIGVQPTGSQDSYGLRRQAIGIIAILSERDINIDFKEIISYSIDLLENKLTEEKVKLTEDLISFFKQRVRVSLIDKGNKYDVVDSVLEVRFSDINDIVDRVETISKVIECSEFVKLQAALTRANNLTSKVVTDSVNSEYFENDYELKLFEVNNKVRQAIDEKLKKKNYKEAIQTLYESTDSINSFFDNIMVIVKDEKVKNNRLALLKAAVENSKKICDFSKINLK